MEIEIRHKAQGKTLEAYSKSRARVSLIIGPLGSGKTIETCYKLFRLMCEQKPTRDDRRLTRFYAVRNTYPDLFNTTVKDWLSLFGDLGDFKQGNKEPPTHSIEFDLEDGTTVISELIFLALDRDDHVKKLRGCQATGFWLNEAKELPKSIVDMADLRHGRYPSAMDGGPSWHGMIGDSNAPDDSNWLYQMAEVVKPDGWEIFKQPGGVIPTGERDGNGRMIWKINPLAENATNLPEGYYVRGLEGKTEDWIRVNLANEYGFVSSGKPVYPEYVDSVHCAPDIIHPDPNIPITLGIDFGRTPAAAFLQRLPSGRVIIFDEFVTEDFSASRFAPELKLYIQANYPGMKFTGFGDPAGDAKGQATEDTPLRVMRAHGVPCVAAHTNNTLIRRSAIINPMMRLCMDGRPALQVSPKCKVLRKGLNGGFCYRKLAVSGDKYTEEPDKNEYSHICEAAEYALLGLGEGREAVKRQTEFQGQLHRPQRQWSPFDA